MVMFECTVKYLVCLSLVVMFQYIVRHVVCCLVVMFGCILRCLVYCLFGDVGMYTQMFGLLFGCMSTQMFGVLSVW